MGDRMTFSRIGKILAALLLASIVLGACTSASPTQRTFGTVSGTLVLEGGVEPGTTRTAIPGTLVLSAHGDRIVTIHVPPTGSFRAPVPTGTYMVTASTPKVQRVSPAGTHVTEPCPEMIPSITVEGGKTTTVNVTCIVP